MEREIFWISISSSLVFLFLAIFSTRFFAASVGLALVAVLIHHSQKEKREVNKEKINKNLDRIESLTTKLFNHLNKKTKNLDGRVKKTSQRIEKVSRDRKNMKGDMNRKLDKMAGKIIEVENRLNNTKEEGQSNRSNSRGKKNINPFSISNSIDEMVRNKGKKK